MSDVNFNSRIIKYAEINKVSEDDAKKKLEQEEEIEKVEKEIEPGSNGIELGEDNIKVLEQAGMLSRYQLSSTAVEYECNGIKFTVDKNQGGSFSYKFDDTTKKLTFSGSKCIININEVTDPDIEVQMSGISMTLNSNVKVKSIKNSGIKSVINGSDEDDNITSTGIDAIINAGKGDDIIKTSGIRTTVRGGEGNDTITASGIQTNIFAGEGDDTIKTTGINIFVDGGAGSDNINGSGINLALGGGTSSAEENTTSKNTIKGSGINVTAFGGKDTNETNEITLSGINVTVAEETKSTNEEIEINNKVINGYNQNDGLMYNDGVPLSGFEGGLLYDEGILYDGDKIETTDTQKIISSYYRGKLTEKSVSTFADDVQTKQDDIEYDKNVRISKRVLTYYEDGEMSNTVIQSDFVYENDYTSTPTSYKEVNPDGTFTVANLVLDNDGDITSCTKTGEDGVEKLWVTKDGVFQVADGEIDGVNYVDGVAQTNKPSAEQLTFINDILQKIGITLETDDVISNVKMGNTGTNAVFVVGAKNSNATDKQIASFNIGEDNYVLEYDESGNVQAIWKNYADDDGMCDGDAFAKYESWTLNSDGSPETYTIYNHKSSYHIGEGGIGYTTQQTIKYYYDKDGNLTGSVKTEDNSSYNDLKTTIISTTFDTKVENKYKVTAYDKDGKELYTIDDMVLPYNSEAFPGISNTTSSGATITFENGKTLEIKSGDSVVINADKTVTVTNNGVTKTYNADGTEKVADEPSAEQLTFIEDILAKIGITLKDGEIISNITKGLNNSSVIMSLDIISLSNASASQIAYFKIGNDTYILNYDDKGNVSYVNKTDNPSIKLTFGGGSENFENWQINSNGKITEHIKGWQENHGTSFKHSIVTTTYSYDEQGNLTSSIETEYNSQSGAWLAEETNIENKYTVTAYDKNNGKVYTIDNKILPYNSENLPGISSTTSSGATITFGNAITLEIKAGDDVVINADKTVTVTNNGVTKTYNANVIITTHTTIQ